MNRLFVDFKNGQGIVKPMHAVNNGPVASTRKTGNVGDFIEAGIPYYRNHDASFCASYGGNFSVDIDFIFPNFDADPYDESSYDFACTDEYVRVCEEAGVKTFYRLGSKIEHEVVKHNTKPPKDFKKWAVICEHIIKHYNCGWANGFHYNIEYWEIWNEPDLFFKPEEAPSPTWSGTPEQFFELFNITYKHLKGCFPKLKIGGPGFAGFWNRKWAEMFFKALEAKPDFFSWHIYTSTPEEVVRNIEISREIYEKYGMGDIESILNEWNYVKGWAGDDFIYTIKSIMGLKGAAFTLSVMLACQNAPVDMLMYYDARPCAFNGLWAPYTFERLKCYYSFVAFNALYKLGENVKTKSEGENLYIAAAKNDTEAAIVVTHFDDDDNSGGKEFTLDITGFDGKTAEYYLLDDTHDLEKIDEKPFIANEKLFLGHNASILIKIK